VDGDDGTSALPSQEDAIADGVFAGSGQTSRLSAMNTGSIQHGAPVSAAPELYAIRRGLITKDADGKPITTMAQVYSQSDAWSVARMLAEIIVVSRMGDRASESTFPSNETLYSNSELPKFIKDAKCSTALACIMRGLLQANPNDRLPTSDAIMALKAALYGPADTVSLQECAAQPDDATGSASDAPASDKCEQFVSLQAVEIAKAESITDLHARASSARSVSHAPDLPASGAGDDRMHADGSRDQPSMPCAASRFSFGLIGPHSFEE